MEFEAGSRDEGELRPSLDAGAADSEAERDLPRDELRHPGPVSPGGGVLYN